MKNHRETENKEKGHLSLSRQSLMKTIATFQPQPLAKVGISLGQIRYSRES